MMRKLAAVLLLFCLLLSLGAPAAAQGLPGGDLFEEVFDVLLPSDTAELPAPDPNRDLTGLDLLVDAVFQTYQLENVDLDGSAKLGFVVNGQAEFGRIQAAGTASAIVSGKQRTQSRLLNVTYGLRGVGLLVEGSVTEFAADGKAYTRGPDGVWNFKGPYVPPSRDADADENFPVPPQEMARQMLISHPLVKAITLVGPETFQGEELTAVDLVISGDGLETVILDGEEGATADIPDVRIHLLIDAAAGILRHASVNARADLKIPSENLQINLNLMASVTVKSSDLPFGHPPIDQAQVDYSSYVDSLLWRIDYLYRDDEFPVTGRTLEVAGRWENAVGRELDLSAVAAAHPELAEQLAAVPAGWAIVVETADEDLTWLRSGKILRVVPAGELGN